MPGSPGRQIGFHPVVGLVLAFPLRSEFHQVDFWFPKEGCFGVRLEMEMLMVDFRFELIAVAF